MGTTSIVVAEIVDWEESRPATVAPALNTASTVSAAEVGLRDNGPGTGEGFAADAASSLTATEVGLRDNGPGTDIVFEYGAVAEVVVPNEVTSESDTGLDTDEDI